jgi:glutamate-1-semialdehyde 2,1-aminomutase
MQEKDVPRHLCKIGDSIMAGFLGLSKESGLKLKTEGIPPLPTFSFDYPEAQAIRTLFTQEMLCRGILASNSVYVSYSHNEQHVEKYLETASEVFGFLKRALDNGKVSTLLRGPVAHAGFKRLA